MRVVTPRAGVWIEISRASKLVNANSVTPRAGVWIEMIACQGRQSFGGVTPRAGVWIEMIPAIAVALALILVTPRAGVWIEMRETFFKKEVLWRHSPCGSVD